jgi:rhodanese-related sulfurtransferase
MLFLLSLLFALETTTTRHLTVEEARALQLKGEAVLVDVRGSVPWELGHIDGAVWLPLGLVNQRSSELPQDKLIVAYCTCKSEETSLEAAAALRKMGFENVAVLTGGYPAWVKAGYPVATVQEVETGGRGGSRLAPPAAVTCDRNRLTVYSGKVTKYSRKASRTVVTIRTDWDTTETITITDPIRTSLVLGTPFTAKDWNRIESKKGVLRPGMRANAWVCQGGRTVVDWQPGGL